MTSSKAEGGGAAQSRGDWLDLAGLVLLAVVAAVLGIFAMLGYSFGLAAWPFAVGASVGDALMYSATGPIVSERRY